MTVVEVEQPGAPEVGLMRSGGAVERVVAAAPEQVYALLADVTRTGEWSPECFRCRWIGGASGAVPGARFRGWNRSGVIRWSRVCEVVEAEPGRTLSFRTVPEGVKTDSTLWRYRFEPVPGGTRVVQSYEVLVPLPQVLQRTMVLRLMPHHADMRPHMAQTLERVAALAETRTLPGQAHAADGPLDLLNVHVMHHAFRRDLALFARAVEATPVATTATWRALAARWERFALALHHHHLIEDELMWPVVLPAAERAGDGEAATALAAMEADHQQIDPLLAGVREGLAAMAAAPSEQARADLERRTSAARALLGEHLAAEETRALPLVQRYTTTEQWASSEKQAGKGFPLREVPFTLAWVTKDLPEPYLARFLATLPAPFRLLLRATAARFARAEEQAFRYA